jgi:hypothetical protein
MSSGEYALDVVLLAVVACSFGVTGLSARRALLPGWLGPPARVAETICGIAALVVVAELLGIAGALARWPFVGAAVGTAGLAAAAGRHVPRTAATEEDVPPNGRAAVAIAWVAVAVAVSRSVQSANDALHGGMLSYDTLWYHLPFAARFAQTGDLTRLHYVGNGPTAFYPANGEVVHTIGMLLFHGDVLSPVVNIAWLALALLAGWCVGRPFGVAPATMLATWLVAFMPVLGGAQAGTAGTDVAVLALLVSAIALLVHGARSRPALGIAALAAGLAVGTKLDAWAAVAGLGLLAVVLARGRRLDAGVRWTVGVAAGGAFWYVRNLATVGNPFPWFGARIDGLFTLPSTTAPTDCDRTSIAHYLPHPGFLSAHIIPQLPSALGSRWWLVVALAAAGAIAALLSRAAVLRGLGVVALVTTAAYLVTPTTAGGHDARCFSFNTRFATPALAIGLILLPLALARTRRGPLLSVLVVAFTLALTVHPSHELVALAGAFVLAGCAWFLAAGRHIVPRRASVAVAVAAGLVAVVVGRHEEQAYARFRYATATFSDPVAPIAGRLQLVRRSRIAVTGLSENYPFYGSDLTNRVEYPARRHEARFLPYTTCQGWLHALDTGGYDYVVTARESTLDSPAAAWTRRYPGARELLASAPGSTHRGTPWTWQLFRLDPARHVDPEKACTRFP